MLLDVFVQYGACVVQFLKRHIYLLDKYQVLVPGTDADALAPLLYRRVHSCSCIPVLLL
jgi:hypothetical protein